MSPEVEKLVAKCVVNYLGGHKEDFDRLLDKAMRLNGEMACKNCGDTYIPCGFGRKGKMKSGYICLKCGQIVSKDEILLRGKQVV